MAEQARCRSCGREIHWATMPSGKLNPLDPPTADGNLAVHRDTKGDLRARPLAKGETPEPHEILGTSHFSTCPRADEHRDPDRGLRRRGR